MWVRKRIDLGPADLAHGIVGCFTPTDRLALQGRIESDWSDSGDALACLSVRSGFDLLLRSLKLPEKSEVLVSAITIPDMVRIIQHHGLVPIPVDLNSDDLTPNIDSLRRAVTPATRAVLVAHLFGSRIPLGPMLEVTRQHGLTLIEDAAQAFDGDYMGDPGADVSMFSFGPIKTSTALGGAILRVQDPQLLADMRREQQRYPLQNRWWYLQRLLKYVWVKTGSQPHIFGALAWAYRALGWDLNRMVNATARGFPGPSFFQRIRKQPCAPLLALLHRRLQKFDRAQLAARVERAELLDELLQQNLLSPTSRMTPHSHWVFPVMVNDPDRVIAALSEVGFDATKGQSMCVVAPPADRPELIPAAARDLLAKTIFLPAYSTIPMKHLRRMADALLRECAASDGAIPRRHDLPSSGKNGQSARSARPGESVTRR